jgi:hypothetical protein
MMAVAAGLSIVWVGMWAKHTLLEGRCPPPTIALIVLIACTPPWTSSEN